MFSDSISSGDTTSIAQAPHRRRSTKYDEAAAQQPPSSLIDRIVVIHPYVPTKDIDWLRVSFDRQYLFLYKDAVLEAEYKRFVFRDLLLLSFCFACSIYCFLFPWILGYSSHWFSYIMYLIGVLQIALGFFEGYIHFTLPQDTKASQWREWNAIAFVFLATNACTWMMPLIQSQCESTPIILPLGGAVANLTTSRKEQYCVEIINPFAIVCQILCLIFVRSRTPNMVALASFNIVAYFAGNFFLSTQPSSSLLIARVSIHFVTYVAGIVICATRDGILRTQFEQSSKVHISSEKLNQKIELLDGLLSAMMPASALSRLMSSKEVWDNCSNASIFFSDIVGFTRWSSTRTAEDVVRMLNELYTTFDKASVQLGVEKIKTIGDAYWAVCGLTDVRPDHAEIMCEFGLQCLHLVKKANKKNPQWENVQIRIGIHSGQVSGGVMGSQQMSYEVFGHASHLAEEVEQEGIAGLVLVSEATRNQLGPQFKCRFYKNIHSDYDARDFKTFVIQRSTYDDDNGDHASSNYSSLISDQSVEETEAQRLNRRRFMLKLFSHHRGNGPSSHRQAVTADHDKATLEAPDMDVGQILARKHQYFFLTFQDTALEAKFKTFTLLVHRHLRLVVRLSMFFTTVIVIGSVWLEGKEHSVASLTILSMNAVCCLCSMVFIAKNQHTLLDTITYVCSCSILIIGTGLIPRGIASNDVTYLIPIAASFLAVGVVGVSAVWICLAYVLFLLIPAIVMVLPAFYITSSLMFMALVTLVVLAGALLTERLVRRQFAEEQVTLQMVEKLEFNETLQTGLLSSILPEHIIPNIITWFENGRDSSKAVSKISESVVVGFFKFSQATSIVAKEDSLLSESFIPEVQRLLEAQIRPFQPTLIKIKTIRDIALIAGPFVDTESPEVAAALLVMISLRLRWLIAPKVLQVGLHVGPVVGTVLGYNRLIFDIFGDTVNTASRVMTTSEISGEIAATEAFCLKAEAGRDAATVLWASRSDQSNLVGRDDLPPIQRSAQFVMGPLLERTMKGKGAVAVRSVTEFDSSFFNSVMAKSQGKALAVARSVVDVALQTEVVPDHSAVMLDVFEATREVLEAAHSVSHQQRTEPDLRAVPQSLLNVLFGRLERMRDVFVGGRGDPREMTEEEKSGSCRARMCESE